MQVLTLVPLIIGFAIASLSAYQVHLVTGGSSFDTGMAFFASVLAEVAVTSVRDDHYLLVGQKIIPWLVLGETVLYCNVFIPIFVWVYNLTGENILLRVVVSFFAVIVALAVFFCLPIVGEKLTDDLD